MKKTLKPTPAMKAENLTMGGLVINVKDCMKSDIGFNEWAKGMKIEYDLTNAHIAFVKSKVFKKKIKLSGVDQVAKAIGKQLTDDAVKIIEKRRKEYRIQHFGSYGRHGSLKMESDIKGNYYVISNGEQVKKTKSAAIAYTIYKNNCR